MALRSLIRRGSEMFRRVCAPLFMPPRLVPAVQGAGVYFSTSSGSGKPDSHDHSGHEHHNHDEHGHEDHDHGDHEHDDHDEHEGHDHDDHEGHNHGHHDHAHDFRSASRKNLIIALTLISTYMLAEVVGGILSGSLALIADAGHMLTDALAIGMALAAMCDCGQVGVGGADLRIRTHGSAGRHAQHHRAVDDRGMDIL